MAFLVLSSTYMKKEESPSQLRLSAWASLCCPHPSTPPMSFRVGLINPKTLSAQFASSTRITESLTNRILAGERTLGRALTLISQAKADVRAAIRRAQFAGMEAVMSTSSEVLRNSIEVAREKGSSN